MASVALPGSTMEKKLKHRLLDEVMAPRHVGHWGRTRHWRRRQTATFCPEKIEMIVDHGRSSGIYVSIIFGDDHPPDLQFCLWTCWSTKGIWSIPSSWRAKSNRQGSGRYCIFTCVYCRSLVNLSMYIDIWWILRVHQHFWVFEHLKTEQTTEHRSQDASVTPGMVDPCRSLWRWKIHGMKDATYTISLDGRFRLLSI